MNWDTHANGSSHWLFYQVDFSDPRHDGSIYDGLFFYLGNASRNTDYHPGFKESVFVQYFFYKILNHFIGHVKVCYHSILHGTDCIDPRMGSAKHSLRFRPHCFDGIIINIDSYDRRLIEHNSFFSYVCQSISSS